MLVEGVPGYLNHALVEWLRTEFGWHRPSNLGGVDQAFLKRLAAAARISVRKSYEIGGISDQITDAIQADQDLFLDVLDATLYFRAGAADIRGLRQILETGASVWTLLPDGTGLQRRVEESALEAFSAAAAPDDAVSAELDEAWVAAFGRDPDPSDAWDHSIKAVEELLVPMVLPGVAKPNLGGVAGQLQSASHKWKLVPTTSSKTLDDARTLAAMVRLIWPNPDRHGGAAERRPPTEMEAQRVVHLAVAIVQLCRAGGLKKT